MSQTYILSNAIIRNYNTKMQKHGVWVFYDSKQEQVEYAIFSNDSLKEIFYKTGYNNHNCFRFCEYKNGRLWNSYERMDCGNTFPSRGTFYNGNGVLSEYIYFKDSCYYLFSTTTFKNGFPDGLEKYFNVHGQLICEGNVCPADTVNLYHIDTTISLYNDTIIDYRFSNVFGVKHGWWKYYRYAGALAFDARFENGELVEVLDYQVKRKSGNQYIPKYYKKKKKAARVTEKIELKRFEDLINYWW